MVFFFCTFLQGQWRASAFSCALDVGRLDVDPCELRFVGYGGTVFPLNSLYMFIKQSLGKISNLTNNVSFNWNVGWLSCFVTWDNRIWEVKHFTATTVTIVGHHLTHRSSIGESPQPTWKIVELYSNWMCLQWLFTSFPLKPTFGEGYFVFFSFNCSEPPENVSVDLGRMYICWHL